jgi:hypothetical protein
MYLLQELLAKPDADADLAKSPPPRTTFYFLDYNELVLKLVRGPSLLQVPALPTLTDVWRRCR